MAALRIGAPLLVLVTASVPLAAPGPVEFRLAPVVERDSLQALQCEVRFVGEPDGETVIRLPDEWGGERALYRAARDLRVEPPGAELLAAADSAHRIVRHPAGVALKLRYTLVQDVPGLPEPNGKNPYRPLVQPGWFHVLGNAMLIAPEWDENTPAVFAAGPWPAGWRFASDLEHVRAGHPLTLGDLYESVSVGGDFRVLARGPATGALRVAIRGAWSFSDTALAERIERVIASHRRFWHDPDEPFLVTVIPLRNDGQSSSLGGTGRSDAFAFFATDNAKEATLNRLLAHEHMHTWIPRRIGGLVTRDEAMQYWLSEGFTDFYSMRLLVRDGLWSTTDYLDAVNEILQRYAQSPMRAASARSAADQFWSNREAQDLPYQRGFLLACKWDDELRQRHAGRQDLDDVMLALKREAARHSRRDTTGRAVQRFLSAMRRAGVDVSKDLERHVTQGEPVLLPADLLGAAARIETHDEPGFDRGFDADATNAAGGVVSGLDPATPGYAAGLRNGMRIVKRESGKPGDARIDLVYRVLDGDSERVIRYRPVGKRLFVTQRIVPADTTNLTLAKLHRRLAGD
ncbi:MAG: hypothetical protein ABL977_12685 [Candidatus Eisenbacteria bacterium]